MELSWIMTVRLAVRQFCAFVQRHTTGQNDDLCMQVKKQVLKRKKKDLYWRSGNMRLFLLFIYFNWSIADLQLIYVSGVQQRDLVIHIPVSIYLTLFQILFSYRSLQNIEQHSLCYPAGTYLSILSILVCVCIYIYIYIWCFWNQTKRSSSPLCSFRQSQRELGPPHPTVACSFVCSLKFKFIHFHHLFCVSVSASVWLQCGGLHPSQ